MTTTIDSSAVKAAQDKLDAHAREIVQWHFSPDTGCPVLARLGQKAGWNPAKEVKGFADLLRFPHFQDEWLRDLQPDVWVPKAFKGKPFNIFETGGTTGMPKQRIGGRITRSITASFQRRFRTNIFHEIIIGS
jgi:phenylacetate-coenzyme A ligase PaaK-like adenylate-forming protein